MRSNYAFKNMPLLLGVRPEGISTYPKKVDYLPCTGITFLGKYLGKKGSCGDAESDCCSVWECNHCGEAFRG